MGYMMFIRIEKTVINTDQIRYISVMENVLKVAIYFSDDKSKNLTFKDINELDSFLSMIGTKDL